MNDFSAAIGFGIFVGSAFGAFGVCLDKLLKKTEKIKIHNRLCLANTVRGNVNISHIFLALFDRVFDPKRTGKPRLHRSALASIIIMSIMFLFWTVIEFEQAKQLIDDDWLPVILTSMLCVGVSTNIVGDFLSLWETRIMISRIARVEKQKYRIMLLILDLILTVIIFLVGLMIGAVIFSLIELLNEWTTLSEGLIVRSWNLYTKLISFVFSDNVLIFKNSKSVSVFLAIFFYTTLFTSIWLWVFMLGAALWPRLTWLLGKFDTKEYPVSVVTMIGGTVLGLIATTGMLFL